MSNRSFLLMIEQLIMLLVFSLATSLCLQCFVHANAVHANAEHQDRAVLIAQNAAELLKHGAEPQDIPADETYPVQIIELDSGIAGLREAEIRVLYEDQPIFQITAGWQEGSE